METIQFYIDIFEFRDFYRAIIAVYTGPWSLYKLNLYSNSEKVHRMLEKLAKFM